ncbi:MAG TPA: ABC transporter ATP-binding protein [Dehalococcoidia bacterium]|nr:ABC transporter ATP-binding protein [Dehalococcoidia bacterium]
MNDLAVEIRGLCKTYGPLEAVRGIDLSVPRGVVYAVIGPNGAGKTTTLEILEGHRKPTSGEARVLGFDPTRNEIAFKQRIGIVLQSTSIPSYLRVEEAIEMFRGYYPHPRSVDEVLGMVDLAEQRRKLVRRLSGGQLRRLDVAIGLAGDPDLLFLDEPTTGLDPAARRAAWGVIRGLRELNKTVLLTTHYMDEAEQLADHVAVIAAGRIVAEGTPDELRAGARDTQISFRAESLPDGLPPSLAATLKDGRAVIESPAPTRALHELTSWATQRGIELQDLRVAPLSLEDVYLKLTAESEASGA